MIFSEKFLDEFRLDPINKVREIREQLQPHFSHGQTWVDADLDILIEGYALLLEALEAGLLPVEKSYPALSGELQQDCVIISGFLQQVEDACTAQASKLKLELLRSKFKTSLGSAFSYEFSQGDLDRVQVIINELRSQISELTSLDIDHRQRLLRRLEKLQSELHKRVSDLDRFWGLIGDAGVVLGKVGKDAKPIVDRIREIADIVWQTQSRAEELPSGTQLPSLENKPSQPSDVEA